MKKRTRMKPVVIYKYNTLDLMFASPDKPMDASKRRHQLTRMWNGLASIKTAETPTTDDWRVCSDAVNLMETMVDMKIVEDTSGLLEDAVKALAEAGKRYKQGKKLRLDAPGIKAVSEVLEDYASVLEAMPARTMMTVHRNTERRIHEILAGKRKPHDVEMIDV